MLLKTVIVILLSKLNIEIDRCPSYGCATAAWGKRFRIFFCFLKLCTRDISRFRSYIKLIVSYVINDHLCSVRLSTKNISVESKNRVIRFNHVCASSAGRIDPALFSLPLHLLPSHGILLFIILWLCYDVFARLGDPYTVYDTMTVWYNIEKTNGKSYNKLVSIIIASLVCLMHSSV